MTAESIINAVRSQCSGIIHIIISDEAVSVECVDKTVKFLLKDLTGVEK